MKTKKSKKNKHGQSDRSDQLEQLHFFQCLNKLFDHSFRYYSLYSESIDDYIQKKKPSLRRRAIYHTITFNALMAAFIYLMIHSHGDGDDIQYLGAPITFLDDQGGILYALTSLVSLGLVVNRLVVLFEMDAFAISVYTAAKVARSKFTSDNLNQQYSILNDMITHVTKFTYLIMITVLLTSSCVHAYRNYMGNSDVIMLIVNMALFSLWSKTFVDTLIVDTLLVMLNSVISYIK